MDFPSLDPYCSVHEETTLPSTDESSPASHTSDSSSGQIEMDTDLRGSGDSSDLNRLGGSLPELFHVSSSSDEQPLGCAQERRIVNPDESQKYAASWKRSLA